MIYWPKKILHITQHFMKENHIGNFSKTTESKLYKLVKVNLQAICAGSIKTSVKRYVQSLFSRYERHMYKVNLKGETETTKVGPLLVPADQIL